MITVAPVADGALAGHLNDRRWRLTVLTRFRASGGSEVVSGELLMSSIVARAVHLAHPAFTDLGDDLVDAEPGSGIQGHGAAPILPLAGRGCKAAHAGARRPTRGRGAKGLAGNRDQAYGSLREIKNEVSPLSDLAID